MFRCSCWIGCSVVVLEICRWFWICFFVICWFRVIIDFVFRLFFFFICGWIFILRSLSFLSVVNYNVSKLCIYDYIWYKDIFIFNIFWIIWLVFWLVMLNRKMYWCKFEYCSFGCCLRFWNSWFCYIEELDLNMCGIDFGYFFYRLLYMFFNFFMLFKCY